MSLTVGIIGLGTMGRGIAKLCIGKGFDVVLLGRNQESGRKRYARLTGDLQAKLDKGKISRADFDSMMSRLKLVEDPKGLAAADIVIETIYEDIKVKEELYRRIEPALADGAIIATNTSSLSIEELSKALNTPSRFVGLHFFNPAEVMKLVEVKRCKRTDDAALSKACEFAKELGKTPIVTPDLPGLYVNRVLFPMLLESISVLEATGAPVAEIDEAMKLGANIPMGPLELCDFIGNDIMLNISNVLLQNTGDLRFKPPKLLERMVQEGKLGRKSGRGFYEYK